MVVKNRAELETPFNTLPPRVSGNETYMNDAVSSILSTFQMSAKKKQEIPRHPGGIWDIDDAMDVTESSATKMELGNGRTVDLIDREKFRQQLNMMDIFEKSNDTSEKILESEDIMDTREPHTNDNATFGKSALQRELGAESVELKKFVSSKNQSEKLKKKNSEESSEERSKRCRTSSITEVYPLLSASTDKTINEADVLSRAVKEFLPPKHLSVQTQEDVYMNEEKIDHQGFTKESQSSSDVKMRKVKMVESSKKVEDVGKLYQKEIDVLRRVTSIFESFGAANPPGNRVSYSVEVEHLQRIGRILKYLEGSNSHLATDTYPEMSRKDVNVPGTCSDDKKMSSGEAVSFLNDIQCDESKSIESPCKDACNGFKDSLKSSEFHNGSGNNTEDVLLDENHIFNKTDDLSKSSHAEKESSSIAQANSVMEKILNGTLPWKPSGSPPPAIAFSGASGQIVNDTTSSGIIPVPTVPSIAINTTSPSKAMNFAPIAIDSAPSRVVDSAPSKAMDSAPSKAMDSAPSKATDSAPSTALDSASSRALDSAPSRAMDTALSSKSKNATPLSKTMDAASPLVAPDKTLSLKSMEPNPLLEKIINGTLPWRPSGSAPPAVAFSGASAQISNHNTQGIVAVSTSPSRSTDAASQFKAAGTTTNAIDTRLPLKDKTPPKAMDAESLSKAKEQESLKDAACLLKDNEPAKLERPLPNTSSASPTKYIAPPKRNFNETQSGRSYERASPLRPILPRRDNNTSPRRYNEDTQSGRTSASQWRVKNGPPLSVNGGGTRNDSNWQNWRIKDKSSSQRDDANTKNNPNAAIRNSGYCHDQVVKKTNLNPNEHSERRCQQEVKVLNIEQKSASGSKPSEDLDAMISLKIFSEENALVDELMVPSNELIRMKRKFPNLFEVVPRADEQDKVLELNANAVKVFLRSVFSMTYTLPCWEIALEAFALAKKFRVEKLQDACKVIFDNKPIYPGQVEDIVHLARKFQITDVLKTSLMFAEIQAYHIPDPAKQVNTKEPQCSVSCTTSVEPSEFFIPLLYMKEKGLGSTIESDIQNDIVFEAKSGSFCITGFQIKLEAESRDLGKIITIFCNVFKSQVMVFGEERHKPLNHMMIINFKQKLLVEPNEDVMISVVIEDVCLRLCHCLLREKELGRCSTGSFETTFTSDKKTQAKQSLFFVEKLFYTYEGQKY